MPDIEHGLSRFPQGLCVVDADQFKRLVWAVERESFRPGDALDAFEQAVVHADADRGAVAALEKIRDKARLAEKDPGGAMAASWVEHVADDALTDLRGQ